MKNLQTHQYWMDQAIALAKNAGEMGEIPVGAVIVDKEGQAITTGVNQKERSQDPTAHAEMVAIREAAKFLKDWHLTDCTLYVTLEPCPMCAGAILQARVSTLVYGADDPKAGAIRTVANLPDSPLSFHKLKAIAGIREQECQDLLQSWFQKLRK
ncbi:nucleoside deaminase [Pseudanabaena sp. FACHB-1998]|uniref:tRNA adenosine(34) deaminase TadA n=1 Tax=Pseudanabaena sp. FACHB-1998 TaxID=2692858 RepID=UPI00168171D3|nr:tRNA adenosine(34) deaminase TadA [Pseudanabaena sp. FACHB-1998]MBD2178505.1 nucleoside deaminase [Pseudanabaena sp. FACHB-1998]